MNPTDHLLTAREGAALLHVSIPTFWRRVADGTVPKPIKIGALWGGEPSANRNGDQRAEQRDWRPPWPAPSRGSRQGG